LPLPVAWPDGLPCPWNRGTVDTVACRETARGKRWSQRSRPRLDQVAGRGRLRIRLGWRRLRLEVGHASTVRPDPSTLGVVGERGSHHEGRSPARSRPLAMSPAPLYLGVTYSWQSGTTRLRWQRGCLEGYEGLPCLASQSRRSSRSPSPTKIPAAHLGAGHCQVHPQRVMIVPSLCCVIG
jgi:hypothetical protein